MNATTAHQTAALARLLKTTRARIVAIAIDRLATFHHLAGVGFEWENEAKKRGYRK